MATRKVPVQEAEAGMLLSQPIMDDKGRTIVPAGARLTPAHVKRLDRWGIQEVAITDDDSPANINHLRDEDSPRETKQEAVAAPSVEEREKMRRIAEAVQVRFTNIGDNPLMDELKRLAVRHLVIQAQQSDIPGVSVD